MRHTRETVVIACAGFTQREREPWAGAAGSRQTSVPSNVMQPTLSWFCIVMPEESDFLLLLLSTTRIHGIHASKKKKLVQ